MLQSEAAILCERLSEVRIFDFSLYIYTVTNILCFVNRINVKLGGINTIPEPASVRYLVDPANPTIVMGADVIHPAPGSEGRPSFTALVGNVDSDTSKYIAATRVQESRREMIDDLENMSQVSIIFLREAPPLLTLHPAHTGYVHEIPGK